MGWVQDLFKKRTEISGKVLTETTAPNSTPWQSRERDAWTRFRELSCPPDFVLNFASRILSLFSSCLADCLLLHFSFRANSEEGPISVRISRSACSQSCDSEPFTLV